jgi:ABC-type Mn2+/Zn2+ transport system permease subunit
MLIGAFLVIPSNIGKILSKSLKWIFIYSWIISVMWVITWLFTSYSLGTSSWATIVVFLIFLFVLSVLYKQIRISS